MEVSSNFGEVPPDILILETRGDHGNEHGIWAHESNECALKGNTGSEPRLGAWWGESLAALACAQRDVLFLHMSFSISGLSKPLGALHLLQTQPSFTHCPRVMVGGLVLATCTDSVTMFLFTRVGRGE